MAAEKREWTVPAPLRALMWWPATAFVLVMVAPDEAASGIAGSGVVLVALGAVVPLVWRRLRRSGARRARLSDDPPTVEMPTVEMPPVGRAA